eukprot:symbB.v1.2.003116.t1/scaffold151.1/size297192/15
MRSARAVVVIDQKDRRRKNGEELDTRRALAAALVTLGGLSPRPSARTEERLVGRMKRFMDVPGGFPYGFIECEETKLRFSRDVYVHRKQMEGLQIGDQVSFTLMLNSKGEPQARNVMKLEDTVLSADVAVQDPNLMDERQARLRCTGCTVVPLLVSKKDLARVYGLLQLHSRMLHIES